MKKLDSLIENYKNSVLTTNWLSDELYKFEWANWLAKKIHFSSQSDEEILAICLASQEEKYSTSKGVQFIKQGAREKLSKFIGIEDVKIFKDFYSGMDLEELDCSQRNMSYPILSCYLSVFTPELVMPASKTNFANICRSLFDVKLSNSGMKFVVGVQPYMEDIKEKLYDQKEILSSLKSKLNKSELSDLDMNWLTQDFLLYLDKNQNLIEQLIQPNKPDRHYWIYAPGEKARLWDEFYEEGIMGLGWDELGDLNNYNTKEDIVSKLQELEKTTGSKKNDATANFDFKQGIQIGDVIIPKKGKDKYLGYGIVTSGYYYDNERTEYRKCRKVDWIKKGVWSEPKGNIVLKTLTDITEYSDYVDSLNKLIGIGMKETVDKIETKMDIPTNQILFGPPGTGKTFALKKDYFSKYTTKETSISKEKHFENVVKECSWWQVIAIALLELKKAKVSNIFEHSWVQQKAVLSDSKTVRPTLWGQLQSHTIEACEFVGVKNRRAPFIFNKTESSHWEIIEDEVKEQIPELYDLLDSVNKFIPNPDKEIKRYKFTTFHQSFSYEDFIEGIKPIMPENGEESEDLGYKIEDGVFKQLCIDAGNDPENRYAIFIDEINRGNVSSIFGELITLLEADKRKGAKNEIEVVLPYSKKIFSVPQNLDVYGTMNTADRSVEALDTALRRRFSFVEMMPKAELLKGIVIEDVELDKLLKTINERIEILIDRDHTIGHAYFINVKTVEDLKETFKNNIIPLLQEYFFGDYGKIGLVLGESFVNTLQPKDSIFAEFKNYDGAQDYQQERFKLITINEEFDIINAVKKLLPQPKED